jgi:hypothetical protein
MALGIVFVKGTFQGWISITVGLLATSALLIVIQNGFGFDVGMYHMASEVLRI